MHLLYILYFMCFVSTYVYITRVSGAHRGQKRGIKSPETGVKGSCEPPCGCWEPDPGPLEKQPVLLTYETSLQSYLTLLGWENWLWWLTLEIPSAWEVKAEDWKWPVWV